MWIILIPAGNDRHRLQEQHARKNPVQIHCPGNPTWIEEQKTKETK